MIINCNGLSLLKESLLEYWKKYYNGEIKRPCDCDCPENCDGNHYYELPTKYKEIFGLNEGV